MKKIKYTIVLLFLLLAYSRSTWSQLPKPTSTQNYISTCIMTNSSGTTYMQNIQYVDGLGRPNQFVKAQQGNTKQDLVYLTEYDGIGRKEKEWLPGVFTQNSGEYRNPSITQTQSTSANAGDSKPYTRIQYEASPLSREKSIYGPGNTWHSQGRGHHTAFTTNQASGMRSCIEFKVNAGSIQKVGYYPNNMLFVEQTTNEDQANSYQFYDVRGRLLLSRMENNSGSHATYYVYDEYDNLRYVIPPMGEDIFNSRTVANDTDADVMNLFYIYKYDNRNRCIAKKLPGTEWIYYIYDAADHLIFTQDGEHRSRGEWSFQIPDAMGRMVLTGTCKNSLSYTADPLASVVVRATWGNVTNAYKGYTVNYTLTTPTILLVNYYDQYTFINYNGLPGSGFNPAAQSGYDTPKTKYMKGLLTGQWQSVLGTTDYICSVHYYDNRDRMIHSRTKNHLGGIDDEWIAYTFDGLPEKRHQIHRAFSATYPQSFRYEYDEGRRLRKVYHNWNNKGEIFLSEYIYDAQGRLSIDVRDRAYSGIDLKARYTYDVRSRITKMEESHLIQNLTYSYGGNVTKYEWTMNAARKAYGYTYDQLDRVLTATYTPATGTANYTGGYTYDKNGNILSLTRYGYKSSGVYGEVDKLIYTRDGNQLKKVDDAAAAISYTYSYDFKDYVKQTTEYTYNRNGAMTQDLNRGVTAIRYNVLNLPTEIDIKSPVAEARNEYLYSADGRKLRVKHRWNPAYSTSPVIGSAVNVSSLTSSQTTDYVGDYVYVNNTLKRVMTPNGYIENGVYHFWIKDYLGSNRMVLSSAGTKVQWTDYYPFGMSFAETNNPAAQQNKYTDQEFDPTHGLNLYDYHARLYDPSIGGFLTMDPLAEKYYNISPYAYVANNPLKYTDPTGKSISIDVKRTNQQQPTGVTSAWDVPAIYEIVGGTLDGDDNIYIVENGVRTGEILGKSLTEYSFFNDNGKAVTGAIIDPNDFSGQTFIDKEIIQDRPSLRHYIKNARGRQHYDFKTRNINESGVVQEKYVYRGMPLNLSEGKMRFASARDIGNYGAGYMAGRHGYNWLETRIAFDALQSYQDKGISIEGQTSQRSQKLGHTHGLQQFYPKYHPGFLRNK